MRIIYDKKGNKIGAVFYLDILNGKNMTVIAFQFNE